VIGSSSRNFGFRDCGTLKSNTITTTLSITYFLEITSFQMFISVAVLGLSASAAACGAPHHLAQQVSRIAIENVHVFDGAKFGALSTVVISGGIISNANPAGATVVDGEAGYLIPGLIDTHCHISDCSYLSAMRQYGVTTALDMATHPYSNITACRESGVTDVKGSGVPGTVNGSAIDLWPNYIPPNELITGPQSGVEFVQRRVEEGADYIKIFLDPLGPDQVTLEAMVHAAHIAGKKVITHAPSFSDYANATQAIVDLPCHVPLDQPVDAGIISGLVANNAHISPTLIMMQSIVNVTGIPYIVYSGAAEGSVTAMNQAGVPILVGTDANASPFVPAHPPFGESIHDELALLVAAGLSNVEAIQGATSLAAKSFGLYDRGVIKTGFRADLVLLSADPTEDISNSRTIQRVWVAGVEAPGL
jgi:imidazolonepropionase-like amidohydrolase